MACLLGSARSAITISRGAGFTALRANASGSRIAGLRATSAFSTVVNSTPYEESWHTREASLQERLEGHKTPLTREEEGLRFQIKHVSNRDVSEREIAPEPRSS